MKDALSVLAIEVPLDEKPIPVDATVPGGGFPLESGEIGNAAISETLAGVETDLDFGLIQPTAVLRRMMHGQAAPERRPEFITPPVRQGFSAMDIEIVEYQVDGPRQRITLDELSDRLGKLGGGAPAAHPSEVPASLGSVSYTHLTLPTIYSV